MWRSLLVVVLILAASSLARGQASASRVRDASRAQGVSKTLAERLGYTRDAKLLIVHADDLGMSHSVNAASMKALDSGPVNSGSIMVPCPWFAEIAAYARSRPAADLGLHLTLTSEWTLFRWSSVLSKERVPTLLASDGYLYPSETEAARHAAPPEVEAELRAQIERARAFGIRPTHLDSHMGTLYQTEALFRVFLKVARDYRLPVRMSRNWLTRAQFIPAALTPDDVVIDRIVEINPDVAPARWAEFYTDAIKNLQPGVTELVVHLAYDDAEMRAATINHPDWGAGWRQRDFDFFTGDAFRALLRERNVKLVTWRETGKLLR